MFIYEDDESAPLEMNPDAMLLLRASATIHTIQQLHLSRLPNHKSIAFVSSGHVSCKASFFMSPSHWSNCRYKSCIYLVGYPITRA